MMKKTRDTESVHWSYSVHHTPREEAYEFACPRCNAKPYDPCIYLSANEWHQVKRLGKPTERPHVERTYLVQRRVYDRRQEQLKNWFSKFGDIFQE
jgi:hypothetical protein